MRLPNLQPPHQLFHNPQTGSSPSRSKLIDYSETYVCLQYTYRTYEPENFNRDCTTLCCKVFHRAPSPGSDHSFNSPQPNSWSSSTGSHPRRLSVTEENDHWNLTETNSEGHFSQHRMSVGSEAMLDPENYRYCLLADRPTKTISALSFTPKAQSSKVILTAASVVGPCTLAALTQNACASIVGSLLPSTNKPQPQLIPLPSCIHNIKNSAGVSNSWTCKRQVHLYLIRHTSRRNKILLIRTLKSTTESTTDTSKSMNPRQLTILKPLAPQSLLETISTMEVAVNVKCIFRSSSLFHSPLHPLLDRNRVYSHFTR